MHYFSQDHNNTVFLPKLKSYTHLRYTEIPTNVYSKFFENFCATYF